jgi:hypothetical protein
LTALSRILVASCAAAGVAVLVWWALDDAAGRSLAGQLLSVGLGLTGATATYLAACRALRVRELGSLLELRRG